MGEGQDREVESGLKRVAMTQLRVHPANSNVMAGEPLEKLVRHIERTGWYPPLIVRPIGGDAYQVLDGHHRWKALERLGRDVAECVVWPADDAEALVLLSTLNRLRGHDDPKRRGALIAELQQKLGKGAAELAKLLPESAEQVKKFLSLGAAGLPRLAEPPPLERMPVSVHFFLSGEQKRRLDTALGKIGGTREGALMGMVDRVLG